MARSVASLPAGERIAYYREKSAEALGKARTTQITDDMARNLDTASRWLALAHEVENVQEHLADFRRDLYR